MFVIQDRDSMKTGKYKRKRRDMFRHINCIIPICQGRWSSVMASSTRRCRRQKSMEGVPGAGVPHRGQIIMAWACSLRIVFLINFFCLMVWFGLHLHTIRVALLFVFGLILPSRVIGIRLECILYGHGTGVVGSTWKWSLCVFFQGHCDRAARRMRTSAWLGVVVRRLCMRTRGS